MRVGLLGGTFDPPHVGHLAAAQALRRCLGLVEVWLVPTGDPCHKTPAASAGDRLNLCRLAAADHSAVQVSSIEVDRLGPSFSVDTVLAVRSKTGTVPVVAVGDDVDPSSWMHADTVRENAEFAVITRNRGPVVSAWADHQIVMSDAVVSSTEVRRILGSGGDPGWRLPRAVHAAIRADGLYGAVA